MQALSGMIGIEERPRFSIADGIRKAAPHLIVASGDPISIPCRLIKSPAEIALMQKADDITVASLKVAIGKLKEGITPGELSSVIAAAHQQLGGDSDGALCLFG